MKKLFIFLISFFAVFNCVKAETVYPVQLNVQLLPPYSNCLSDYLVEGMERMRLTALVRDLSRSSYTFTIHLTIRQGSQVVFETKSSEIDPYSLQSGEIKLLNVQQMFDPNKATVTINRYHKNGYCLPEGTYEFVYQAFDATYRNRPVSEPVRISQYLGKAQPARLSCFDCADAINTINFNWYDSEVLTTVGTDRKYKLEVYEVPEGNSVSDMDGLAASLQPVFSDVVNSNLQFYSLQNTAGKLQTGKTYVWRVKTYRTEYEASIATTENNVSLGSYETSDYYQNGGYSPFCSFRYCATCNEDDVEFPCVKTRDSSTFKADDDHHATTIKWYKPETIPDGFTLCGYQIIYREELPPAEKKKQNQTESESSTTDDDEWYTIQCGTIDTIVTPKTGVSLSFVYDENGNMVYDSSFVDKESYKLKNLNDSTWYRVGVKGIFCSESTGKQYIGDTCNTVYFFQPRYEPQCLNHTISYTDSSRSVTSLAVGDKVYLLNQTYYMVITYLESSTGTKSGNSTPTFSGQGYIRLPFAFHGLKFLAEFSNIEVNFLHQMRHGTVKILSNASTSASVKVTEAGVREVIDSIKNAKDNVVDKVSGDNLEKTIDETINTILGIPNNSSSNNSNGNNSDENNSDGNKSNDDNSDGNNSGN